jgi:hypothetical protein
VDDERGIGVEETTSNAYSRLKHCPECGQELDLDTTCGDAACWFHGDFVIENDKIVWNYVKDRGE